MGLRSERAEVSKRQEGDREDLAFFIAAQSHSPSFTLLSTHPFPFKQMSSVTPKPKTPLNHAPKGTRHKIGMRRAPRLQRRPPAGLTAEERQLRREELEKLPEYIKEKLPSWSDKEPKPFQLDAIRAQHLGEDAIVHAGTGSGKTFIAAGPHLLPSNQGEGKVTLFISPLLALHEEQVCPLQ